MDINIITTALISLATGVIGYLIRDNTMLRESVKALRGLVFILSARILDDDKATDESKDTARKAVEELQNI